MSLEEVINHYENPIEFLKKFQPTKVNADYIDNFKIFTHYFSNTVTNQSTTQQINLISPMLPKILSLNEQEKLDLIDFLKNALTKEKDFVPEELKNM